MAESTLNLLKIEDDDRCCDRISNLPDSILSHILSRLPLKDALATTVLAKRWRNIFPFGVPPFRITLDDSSSTTFEDFVDRLLSVTFSGVARVQSLDFRCQEDYGDAKIVSWIDATVRLNIEDLMLNVFSINDTFSLFQCLNGCRTLHTLEFRDTEIVHLQVPDNFSLPNLKMLIIHRVKFGRHQNVDAINALIAGCPMLEGLLFWRCYFQFVGLLCIRSHSLKSFHVEQSSFGSTCGLVLEAPNLEQFFYEDYDCRNLNISKFYSIVRAHIDVDQGEGVMKLVTACSSTTIMSLSGHSIAALYNSVRSLPVFPNLSHLELGFLGFTGWAILAHLLRNTPYLQELRLVEGFYQFNRGFANFELLLPCLPTCLERHITSIEFGSFEGTADELKLIEYLLRNGNVLETLQLDQGRDCKRLIRKLLTLPNHSKILLGPELEDGFKSLDSPSHLFVD